MKTLRLLSSTALMGVVLVMAAPGYAHAAQTTKTVAKTAAAKTMTTTEANNFYVNQLKESGQMMGQINLARQALDVGLTEDALYHLDKAQKVEGSIEAKSPKLTVASTLRMNDKVYTSSDEYKTYLVPVVDDLFTAADYDIKVKRNPSKDGIAEDDAEIGRFKLSLNLNNVKDALTAATDYAKQGEVLQARMALDGVFDGAVEQKVAYDDPIWSIHDNMMAANTLLQDHDYAGARYAMKKAEVELKQLKASGAYPKDSAVIEDMSQQVATLNADLKNDNPGIVTKAETSIKGWLKSIGDIGHHNDKLATH